MRLGYVPHGDTINSGRVSVGSGWQALIAGRRREGYRSACIDRRRPRLAAGSRRCSWHGRCRVDAARFFGSALEIHGSQGGFRRHAGDRRRHGLYRRSRRRDAGHRSGERRPRNGNSPPSPASVPRPLIAKGGSIWAIPTAFSIASTRRMASRNGPSRPKVRSTPAPISSTTMCCSVRRIRRFIASTRSRAKSFGRTRRPIRFAARRRSSMIARSSPVATGNCTSSTSTKANRSTRSISNLPPAARRPCKARSSISAPKAGTFFAIDWKQAKIIWRWLDKVRTDPMRSSAALTPEAVIFGGRDKRVRALDPLTGKVALGATDSRPRRFVAGGGRTARVCRLVGRADLRPGSPHRQASLAI